MSNTNTSIVKRSFKFLEIPLNKFQNEAIPHHQELFLKHKTNIQKLSSLGDYEQADRELKDKKRIIRQLKELMYELDTLRTQVEDVDLDKFDGKTVSMRKIILELISGYSGLEKEVKLSMEEHHLESNENILQNAPQLQIQEDLDALKLQQEESNYKRIQALNNDIEDVHGIFVNLNKMVTTQKEHVDHVEVNTEVANINVQSGLFHLINASKLKKASYPVAGACIGTLIGGPIGSIAGLKIGGLAAISCGVFGYVGGRFFKNVNDAEVPETQVELTPSNRGLTITTADDKKDI